LQQSGLAAVDFFGSVDGSYGIEEDGLASDDRGVEVPRMAVRCKVKESTCHANITI